MPSKSDILSFIRSQPTKRYLKGEILLRQGDEPEVLYGIKSGFIKAYDIASDGSEQLIWLAKKEDVVPLEWLFSEYKSSPYFYAAFTDTEVYAINKALLLEHLRVNNEALLMVVEAVANKYRQVMSHLNATQKPRARDKIMYLLNFVAMRFSHQDVAGVEHVEVPFTHQDFANLVGLARETTTLELKKLKEQGIVDYDKNNFYIKTKKLSEAMQ